MSKQQPVFSDEDGELLVLRSQITSSATTCDSDVQTKNIKHTDNGTQMSLKNDVETQTETGDIDPKLYEVADEEVAEFLRNVYPAMSHQLQRNSVTHAFDDYTVQWEEERDSSCCLYTLNYRHGGGDEDQAAFVPMGLTWNSTGAILAVGYGRRDHKGWCSHSATVCCWNLFRRDFDVSKPTVVLECTGCLTSIAFHPDRPSLLAGATFNGEVYVWDISRSEDPVLYCSVTSELFHREAVHQTLWVPDPIDRTYHLATASVDGKLLFWPLDQRLDHITRGFLFSTSKGNVAGVTCVSFSCEDRSACVVGSEGGLLLKCFLPMETKHSKQDKADALLPNPTVFQFEPHLGPVQALEFSPFHRNVFLSCSTDGFVRLFHMFQTKSVMSWEPSEVGLSCAAWSRMRACVFAAGAADGSLYIYDLMQNRHMPVTTLYADNRSVSHLDQPGSMENLSTDSRRSITAVAFNPKQRDFMAAADASGRIRIIQLSYRLSNVQTDELPLLDAMVDEMSQEHLADVE
eukprot:GILK01005803.1.p1 GENE.GILK01005803.1~~GILK01005803.1.p1  ORF type:complete len:531 (-),score=70.77 GILK01005803.1:74-1624(-)